MDPPNSTINSHKDLKIILDSRPERHMAKCIVFSWMVISLKRGHVIIYIYIHICINLESNPLDLVPNWTWMDEPDENNSVVVLPEYQGLRLRMESHNGWKTRVTFQAKVSRPHERKGYKEPPIFTALPRSSWRRPTFLFGDFPKLAMFDVNS